MTNLLHFDIVSLLLVLIMTTYTVSAASEYLGNKSNNVEKGLTQLHQDELGTAELVSHLVDEVKDIKMYLRELLPTDCYAAKFRGSWTTKTLISPPGLSPRHVVCDQQTSGGGWTLVLRRQPAPHSSHHHTHYALSTTRENFNCSWNTYKSPFGSLDGEFWIGLDVLHALTAETPHELLVKITDDNGNSRQAKWKTFSVGAEEEDFKLTIGAFESGDSEVFDALAYHNSKPFSTYDRDNSQYEYAHCGNKYGGGWWFGRCHHALLTGDPSTAHESKLHGITWYNKTPRGSQPKEWLSLTHAVMMIRPTFG